MLLVIINASPCRWCCLRPLCSTDEALIVQPLGGAGGSAQKSRDLHMLFDNEYLLILFCISDTASSSDKSPLSNQGRRAGSAVVMSLVQSGAARVPPACTAGTSSSGICATVAPCSLDLGIGCAGRRPGGSTSSFGAKWQRRRPGRALRSQEAVPRCMCCSERWRERSWC